MGIPVRELLARTTSHELSEYMAYEKHAGPLSHRWRDDVQAEIHYLLQWTNYLLGAAHLTQKGKKNPVPLPKFAQRSWVPDSENREDEIDLETEDDEPEEE